MNVANAGPMPERRIVGRVIITLLLSLLSVNALAQVVLALIGESTDPMSLRAWQALSGLAAGAAAVGAWRLRRWAPAAVIGYAAITAAMIASLGPMLDLPPEDRAGLPVGAAAVVAACLPIAWYVRRLVRRSSGALETPDLLEARGVSFPASARDDSRREEPVNQERHAK